MSKDQFSKDEQKQQTLQFLEAFSKGEVCVHPTDTIPGLTCDPRRPSSVQNLDKIKKRGAKKSFVALVDSFDSAQKYWEPLPTFWQDLIRKLWPGPITFVWKARANLPTCIVSHLGEIALRHPRLSPETVWFEKVMEQILVPIPSTSINYADGKPILGGKELEEFCAKYAIYLPKMLSHSSGTASTVVRILDETRYEFLRVGAVSEKEFLSVYKH